MMYTLLNREEMEAVTAFIGGNPILIYSDGLRISAGTGFLRCLLTLNKAVHNKWWNSDNGGQQC
jgi:hypothetical protein